MLTTNQKGAIAEAAFTYAAVKAGIGVFTSVVDERYDLVLDLRPRLVRAQCKTAPLAGDVVVVRCYSSRRCADGLRKTIYGCDEIDAFGAYCPDLERCYLLPIELFRQRTQVVLRVAPSRNNQRTRINWASDFEFPATLARHLGP
jgi:hypothetical protein